MALVVPIFLVALGTTNERVAGAVELDSLKELAMESMHSPQPVLVFASRRGRFLTQVARFVW